MSKLDDILVRTLEQIPDWQALLSPEEIRLVTARLQGVTFRELGSTFGRTPMGVLNRLYGTGHGGRRKGGLLGRLRGHLLAKRKGAGKGDPDAA